LPEHHEVPGPPTHKENVQSFGQVQEVWPVLLGMLVCVEKLRLRELREVINLRARAYVHN
jgi:hypothetical protein